MSSSIDGYWENMCRKCSGRDLWYYTSERNSPEFKDLESSCKCSEGHFHQAYMIPDNVLVIWGESGVRA